MNSFSLHPRKDHCVYPTKMNKVLDLIFEQWILEVILSPSFHQGPRVICRRIYNCMINPTGMELTTYTSCRRVNKSTDYHRSSPIFLTISTIVYVVQCWIWGKFSYQILENQIWTIWWGLMLLFKFFFLKKKKKP